jgi:hypothetical protein
MENDAKVVFVNNLEVSGFVNGVLNLAFSTAQFVPDVVHDDGEYKTVVTPAPVITANLRMDLWLAQQLRDRLDEIIEANTKPQRMAS